MTQLTKQEVKAFAALQAGASIEDAYKEGFPAAKNWKETTVKAKATRLFNSTRFKKIIESVVTPKATRKKVRSDKQLADTEAVKELFTFNENQKEALSHLTALQARIVLNVVKGNMRQRDAYYAAGGVAKSDDVADCNTSIILARDDVKKFYEAMLEGIASDAIMTREEALTKLTVIARSTVKNVLIFSKIEVGTNSNGDPVYQSTWEIKKAEDMSDEHASAIAEITASGGNLKCKLHSQPAAIKQLAEMQGWNSAQKHDVNFKTDEALETITEEMTPKKASEIYQASLKTPTKH